MTLSNQAGTLYVVATPIGHLDDLSARALQVLAQVKLIAAEDTRHTRKLLLHYGLDTPMLSLHEHNESERVARIQRHLQQGEDIALVSDAGTPLISDPGFVLVRELRRQGLRVSPVPGPSALLAALSASGLPTDRFVFEGFLPAKPGARRKHLAALAGEARTLVFYESGRRMAASLADCIEVFGASREACIARELTKRFETLVNDSLAGLLVWFEQSPDHQRGEFVLVVGGRAGPAAVDESELLRTLSYLVPEIGVKRASVLAARMHEVNRGEAYRLALTLRDEHTDSGSPV